MSFTTPLPDSKINQCARNRLGEAIYLLAHIIRKSDWKTGKLRTSQSRIASETGFPEATVKKWIQKLVDVGEIICEKTLNGSIITIRDYSPIARTRGVKNQSRSTVNGTKFGPNEGPEMNPDGTTDGPNHVIRILSQNNKKNSFQILSSSLCDKEELSEGETERPMHSRKVVESDMERQERIAMEFMARADEATKQEFIDQALESMENDERPFVRIFVKRNERGDREFVSHSGDGALMARIGLMLESREGDS